MTPEDLAERAKTLEGRIEKLSAALKALLESIENGTPREEAKRIRALLEAEFGPKQ